MNKYIIALCLCLLGTRILATESTTEAHYRQNITTGIVEYWPSVIAEQLNSLEKYNLSCDFNLILKDVLCRLEQRKANKLRLITNTIGMTTGLALAASSGLYMGLGCMDLAKKYGIWATPLENLLVGTFAGVAGIALSIVSHKEIGRIRRCDRSTGNFHGIAATLSQIKNSPACYISDVEFAEHLLAQISALVPATERSELAALIRSIKFCTL